MQELKVSNSDKAAVTPSRLKTIGLVFAVLSLCVMAVIVAPQAFSKRGHLVSIIGPHLFTLLVSMASVHFALIRFGGFSPTHLGLATTPGTWRRFALGLLIGFNLQLVTFAIAWGRGALTVTMPEVEDSATAGSLLLSATVYLLASLFEEIAFRAALVGPLMRVLPPGLAIGIPSALFGLLHGLNPGATTLGVLNTVVGGLLLGLLYLESRGRPAVPSIGLAWGFHFAWNFTMGPVLGVPVSGHIVGLRMLETHANDFLWSGGSYGLEGGLAASITLIGATVIAARFATIHLQSARTPNVATTEPPQ